MVFIQSEPQARFGLSIQDLFDISQAISREFSPYIAKSDELFVSSIPFSHQELLSVSEEISREFAPRAAENRTKLVLLPIDTQRLHAYWHIAENKPSLLPMPFAGQDLTLRIFQQADSNALLKTTEMNEQSHWFDVAIGNGQFQQEVLLPENMQQQGAFCAAIGSISETHAFTPIASSNLASMPNRLPQLPPADKLGLSTAASQIIMSNANQSSSVGKSLS